MATKTLKDLGLKKGQSVKWLTDRGTKRAGIVQGIVPAKRSAAKMFKGNLTAGTSATSSIDRVAVLKDGILALPKWWTKFRK